MPNSNQPNGIRVLNVDDNDAARYLRGRVLAQAGFEVEDAPSGMDALRMAGETRPQVVLLDVRLPDIDGFEVCRRLRAAPMGEQMVIVHVTQVAADARSHARGLENGADAYLTEPLDGEVLVSTVRALLRARAAEQRERQLRAELEREQGYLRAVLEQLPSGVAIAEAPSGKLLVHNQEAVRLLGHPMLPSEDVSGYGQYRALEQEGAPQAPHRYPIARALAGETVHQEPMLYRRGDGTLSHFLVSAAPLRDRDGKIVAATSTFHDVSELIKVQDELIEVQKRLELALESAELGTWEIDLTSGIVTASERTCAIFGFERPKPHVADWMARTHPEDRERATLEIEEAVRDRSRYETEYRIVRPDGSMRWVYAQGLPAVDSQGRATRFVGVAQDTTARRQAERTRERERELLQGIVDNIPVMLCLYDPDLGRFHLNRSFETLTGWTTAEANEGDFMAMVYPEQAEREAAAEHMRSLAPGWREFRVAAKDGSAIPSEWANIRLSDDRMIGIGIDVRARKQADKAVRESEERYRTLFESMQEGFALCEVMVNAAGEPVDWRYLDVNPAFETIHGLRRADVIGRTYRELFPEGRWEYWVPRIGEVALTGKQAQLEQFDSGRYWQAVAYSPRRGQVAIIFTDVSERKRAEVELARQKQEYEALAENAPEVIARFDTELRHIYINNFGASVYGVPKTEILGKTNAELGMPDDKVEFWKTHFRQVLDTGQQQVADFTFDSPTYGRRHFSSLFVPETDAGGRVTSILAITRDVTDAKAAEERLREAQKRESIGLLAGGVAHDFNNLLTSIMGNASMLVEDLPAESAEMAAAIVRSTERAADLTRQLLAYAGKGRLVVQEVDVSALVREMTELLSASIPKKVSVALDLASDLPTVQADPGQVQQIVMNLLLNAAEAIPGNQSGTITIRTRPEQVSGSRRIVDRVTLTAIAPGGYVCLEVDDTGIGMDETMIERVFDPFFTTKFTGRGLGLAAVAGIVRTAGGGIEVASTPGAGSTFRVYLPSAGGRHDVGGAPEEASSNAGSEAGTVLVVDDEDVVRRFVVTALEKQGYRALSAKNGQDALDAIEKNLGAIDVVLLDLTMPVMGGEEVADVLAKTHPDLKIVVMTPHTESEAKRLFAGRSIASFIEKPFPFAKLAEHIKAVMEDGSIPRV